MEYRYRATIKADPDGGFLVTFDDVPEAITAGDTRAEAESSAAEALGLALRGILAEGRALPEPAAKGGVAIPVEAATALKLAVIEAHRAAGISKSELARRIGKADNEAHRLLDPDYPSKLPALEAALVVLGKRIVVSVEAA